MAASRVRTTRLKEPIHNYTVYLQIIFCRFSISTRLCPTANEIKEQLEKNWIKFLNHNCARFSLKTLTGATPPSVFVGRYGYPKVEVGPMVPPLHGDTTVLDKPEMWLGKSIEEIVEYRLSLVRGISTIDINSTSGKYVESLQEVAMASNSVESEATFEKTPILETGNRKICV
jgi:DNA repair protein NreA